MSANLRDAIDALPIVDDHAHLGLTEAMDEMDYPKEEKMQMRDSYLPPAPSSFGFPYLGALHTEAYVKYYGFSPEDLGDMTKYAQLAAEYEKRRLDLVNTTETFMKAGNVEHVISNMLLPKKLEGHPAISFIPLVDPLLFPFGCPFDTARPNAKEYARQFDYLFARLQAAYGKETNTSYADYMAFVDWTLADYAQKGYVGYKFICSYVRSTHFAKPTADGEGLFGKAKAGDAEAYMQFQNHMAWYIMRHAAENDIPVQFHTALIDPCIDYTDPYSLVNFLQDDVGYNTKIVLLHAGYPLFTHAKAMAMAAKPLSQNNVYIDISGRVMFANDPNVIARMLRDFLDVPALWGKLLYGSDTLLGERFLFTAAHTARDAVYKATSAMLQEGMVTGELAIKIARDILRNNAIRLYKLPLEII